MTSRCGGAHDPANVWLLVATGVIGAVVLLLYAALAMRGPPQWLWGIYREHKPAFACASIITAVSFVGLIVETAINTTVTPLHIAGAVVFLTGAVGWAAVAAATVRFRHAVWRMRAAVVVTAVGSCLLLAATLMPPSECSSRHPLSIVAASVVAAHHSVGDMMWALYVEPEQRLRAGDYM